ncbi:uncharacterized protein LOC116301285 isoform X2 [Actinia tenebrosa]|uniref:Uncharacterized protein LOC116301285 isoform X2 n=1 Tax=Actinia tenebrosa TaxID=6105 RepID=A0A6P8II12_ACTTE|nr:uncharacterized protein LOC116301285 isoform X2 [Actinia tenebrosa]
MWKLSLMIFALLAFTAYADDVNDIADAAEEDQVLVPFDESVNEEKRVYGRKGSKSSKGKGKLKYGGRKGSKSSKGKWRLKYGGRKGSKSSKGKWRLKYGGRKGSKSSKGKGKFKYGGRKGSKSSKGKWKLKYGGRKGSKSSKGKGKFKYGGRKGSKSSKGKGSKYGKGRHRIQGMGGFSRGFNCIKNPCLNEGVCCGRGPYQRCICPAGFKGKRCETDINECARNPCKRGAICFDQVNGYTCKFPDSTEVCKIRQTTCSSKPCQNKGVCKAYKRSYRCICPKGFAGKNCQINIDECGSNPCQNGAKCVDRIGYYVCVCPRAYKGTNCEEKRGGCSVKNICRNGGTCVEENGSWACICRKGFSGPRCGRVIKDCSTNPCLHGGTCCDRTKGFICKCREGFLGRRCEKKDLDLYVPEGQGQLTFQEDGSDDPKSAKFSRRCRYGGKKGIIVGRGYELGGRTRKQVFRDLRRARFPRRYAMIISRAAGLKGKKAIACFKKYRLGKFRITKQQQKRLFKIYYAEKVKKGKKYLSTYCKLKLDKMSQFQKDLIMDLYIDGALSYASPQKRKNSEYIKKVLDSNNLKSIKALLNNKNFWVSKMKTSARRFESRKKFCQKECKKTRRC